MEQRSTSVRTAPTGTQAIERAFAVLRAFTSTEPVWTLAALSRHLHLTKPTVLRLLGVLEREAMIQRTEPMGSYRLGPGAIQLGAVARRSIDFHTAARPELQRLAWSIGETASLEVLVGSDVMIVDEIRGRFRGSTFDALGSRWPAHAAATGKVLLADARNAGSDAWQQFVRGVTRGRLPRFTDRTITTMNRLLTELSRVSRQGYATGVEELESGYVAIAVPISDFPGNAVAALCVGGPVARLPARRFPALVRELTDAAQTVSRRLGG